MDKEYSHLESEMNRGFLQILVLSSLEKPMYGYQMLRHFEESGYVVEENTLYPLLRRLEKNEMIKSEWDVSHDRPRKFYVISDKGKRIKKQLLSIRTEQNDVLSKLLEEKNV